MIDTSPITPPTISKKASFFKEMLIFGGIALIVVLPIRLFIAQPFIVSGDSMDPTFANNQYLIVDELTYRIESVQRAGSVRLFARADVPRILAAARRIADRAVNRD